MRRGQRSPFEAAGCAAAWVLLGLESSLRQADIGRAFESQRFCRGGSTRLLMLRNAKQQGPNDESENHHRRSPESARAQAMCQAFMSARARGVQSCRGVKTGVGALPVSHRMAHRAHHLSPGGSFSTASANSPPLRSASLTVQLATRPCLRPAPCLPFESYPMVRLPPALIVVVLLANPAGPSMCGLWCQAESQSKREADGRCEHANQRSAQPQVQPPKTDACTRVIAADPFVTEVAYRHLSSSSATVSPPIVWSVHTGPHAAPLSSHRDLSPPRSTTFDVLRI
jgi:hypothetical protein